MSKATGDVAAAIASFHKDELHAELMLWQVICCDEWLVPVTQVDGETTIRMRQDAEGNGQLVAYSEPNTLEAAKAGGEADDLDGAWVVIGFETLLSALSDDESLSINPHTDYAIGMAPAGVQQVKNLASMSGIERALSITRSPPVQPGALQAIAAYPDFEVIVRGSNTLDLAPDPQGRQLLAAFTEPEARDLYLEQVPHLVPQAGIAKVLKLTGAELAQKLTELEILGVVFNCAGPRAPLALHRNLGQQVLEAARA